MKTLQHLRDIIRTGGRRPAAIAVLMAVGLAAAGPGSSTALAGGGPQTEPLHVSLESDFVTVGTCDYGAPLQAITGVGHATHLGRFDVDGLSCLSQPTGSVTWTAANGDQIMIVFTTELGPIGADGSATIAMPAVSVSGTGRFANVSLGEDDVLAGTVWFDALGNGHLEASVDGTIAYDASDRSH